MDLPLLPKKKKALSQIANWEKREYVAKVTRKKMMRGQFPKSHNITWYRPILAGRGRMTSFRIADQGCVRDTVGHGRVRGFSKPNEYSSVLQLPWLLQISPYFVCLKIKKVVKYKFYWCETENPCFVPCRGLLGWNYFQVSHFSWKPDLLLGIWRPVCERWLHGWCSEKEC